MGGGSSVDVWNSSWIPRASSQRPLGRRPEAPASMLKVSDLLTDDGLGWNDQKLRQFMYEFDVEDIKKIPVGGPGGRGLCCLELDEEMKNGQFLVRSAYHLKMQQKDIHSGGRGCSNSVEAQKGWLALWGCKCPRKGESSCVEAVEKWPSPGCRTAAAEDQAGNCVYRMWAGGDSPPQVLALPTRSAILDACQ